MGGLIANNKIIVFVNGQTMYQICPHNWISLVNCGHMFDINVNGEANQKKYKLDKTKKKRNPNEVRSLFLILMKMSFRFPLLVKYELVGVLIESDDNLDKQNIALTRFFTINHNSNNKNHHEVNLAN